MKEASMETHKLVCVDSTPLDTYVFWCARWMQLKMFPFSGSSLYILGYCEER